MEDCRAMPAPDKKRKRSAPEEDRANNSSADGSAAVKEETSEPSSAPTRPPPSDEEVEEFFALLRRIHNAGKRSGKSNQGKVRSARLERAPLINGESSSAGKIVDKAEEEADNGVMIFDLNAAPDEAAEASGC